ncbi:MAG: ATP-dependent helicase, partial [Thermodesulfobacteriota bacterium]|nr:ATP-dependent helicase [Thermodesulfobacteriota bacterium]
MLLNRKIDYEKELNPAQLESVMASEGPVLILAGAGSGKTRVLIYKVAYLLEKGVKPEEILLVTFTNKAAREMLTRVKSLLGFEVNGLWGGTFHHVANLFLRKYHIEVDFSGNFGIMDEEDAKNLMSLCRKEKSNDFPAEKFARANLLKAVLSYSINGLSSIDDVLESRFPELIKYKELLEEIFSSYNTRKRKNQLMDFDDLLYYLYALLTGEGHVREILINKFKYILVDEYQDTSPVQARIIDEFSLGSRNLIVVGDDAQSIYSFRGAEFKNILEFPQRYPDVKIYMLEYNYRSTPEILNLANAIIRNNKNQFPKKLKTTCSKGVYPLVVAVRNVYEQGQYVVSSIEKLADSGIPLENMAILYRSHFHSMELQMELTKRRIPFSIHSGYRFFEQAHIKDILAFLKILENKRDELAWRRIFNIYEGIGPKTREKVLTRLIFSHDPIAYVLSEDIINDLHSKGRVSWKLFQKNFKQLIEEKEETSPAYLIKFILEANYIDYLQAKYENFRERKDDIEHLANFSLQYNSLVDLLAEVALQEEINRNDMMFKERTKNDKLTLTTIHRAKGLEWEVVFILYLTHGYFPVSQSY